MFAREQSVAFLCLNNRFLGLEVFVSEGDVGCCQDALALSVQNLSFLVFLQNLFVGRVSISNTPLFKFH